MAQQATNVIPPKGLWTLKIKDFINGLYLAVLPQLLVMLDFFSNSSHFPTYAEWQPYLKASVVTLLGYLIKNLGTNNVGQFGKKDKPVVAIGQDELNQLQSKTN